MRETIGVDGVHYRIKPNYPNTIEEQALPGQRWRVHSRWATHDMAAQVLATLGRLSDFEPDRMPHMRCVEIPLPEQEAIDAND